MGLDLRAKRRMTVAAVLGSIAVSAALAVCQSGKLQKDSQRYKKPELQEKLPETFTIKVDEYFCYDSAKGLMDDPYVKEMSSMRTTGGNYFFTCADLNAFREDSGTVEYAKELAALQDRQGNLFFTTGNDVVAFKNSAGSYDYAARFASAVDKEGKKLFSGNQLAQLYSLGLDLQQLLTFTDTAKPNALLVYPTSDRGTFRNEASIKFFKKIQEGYDTKVVVASREGEVYGALESRDDFELLVLLGHGAKTTLSLGENDLRLQKAEKDETYTIDTSDWELETYLRHLTPNAVIFLYSCNTGEGRGEAQNLANAIAEWGGVRKVIAPTEVLNTSRVTVNSLYPFDVTLIDEKGERDITYKRFLNLK